MSLTRTTSANSDFQHLVSLLDSYLRVLDGDDHAFYAQYNTIDMLNNVVVFYDNGFAVGCGAFKPFDERTVEIKRMFVLPEYRGKGIAKLVLAELEQWAVEIGYVAAVLETGKQQIDAVALYSHAGYRTILNYGQYEFVENSVCMKKEIA